MREFKFRAFSKELGGFLAVTDFEICKNEITGIFHDGDFIGYDKKDISLMQYTGLKDKNGKEIYEGDIVLKGKEQCGERIEYTQGRFRVTNYDGGSDDLFNFVNKKEIEVISNIYEEPNLLEE